MRSKVHSVREIVAELRAALLAPTPENLESQLPALERAAAALRESGPEPASPGEIRNLAFELLNTQRLTAHGLETQQALARLLAASLGGYRSDGEPSPVAATGGISVQG